MPWGHNYLILLSPSVRQQVPVFLYWAFGIHSCDLVYNILKIFKGVDAIEHARQGQRVEHGSPPAPSSVMKNKELRLDMLQAGYTPYVLMHVSLHFLIGRVAVGLYIAVVVGKLFEYDLLRP